MKGSSSGLQLHPSIADRVSEGFTVIECVWDLYRDPRTGLGGVFD